MPRKSRYFVSLNSLFGISFVVTWRSACLSLMSAGACVGTLNSLFGISFVVTRAGGEADALRRRGALNSLFGISFVVTTNSSSCGATAGTTLLSIPFLGFLLL